MRMSWKIGRVAGIDLYLHPTCLMLLAYVGIEQGTPGSILLVSVVFGCLLLHELGHALMARRFGIQTADITLYPIGGVARLYRLPRAPGAEMLIALAGPAVNVAIALMLGVGLVVLGWDPRSSSRPGPLVEILLVNLLLAGFNMIPAFPMDGGRVLRALLSGWLGRCRATEIAAALGQGLALTFGLYSALSLAFDLYSPLPLSWLNVVLAAFIFFAAGMELAQVRAEERRRLVEEGNGIWVAPPGYSWVNRGDGVWQLAPIVVPVADRAGPWR